MPTPSRTGQPKPRVGVPVVLPVLTWPPQRLDEAHRRLLARVHELECDLAEARDRLARQDGERERLAALGERTALVAHEIRSPLNAIEGFAELLAADLPSDDPRRTFASHVAASARGLNTLLTNLLDHAQPFIVRPRLVSVSAVVEEALAFAVEDARRQGCRALNVQTSLAPEADAIEADPDMLRQALLNLLANAVRAMPEGGTLRVVCRVSRVEGEEAVEIWIEDTGCGISEEVRERVLDPFVTTRRKGMGLGLAVVQAIARRHGGALAIDSGPEGGTAAVLTLPRRASAEEPMRSAT